MRCLYALLALAAATAGRADAAPREYVAEGAELRYRAVTAPVPADVIGARGLRSIDRARGQSAATDADVLGPAPGSPSRSWPVDLELDAKRGAAPLAARDDRGRCKRCGTVIGDDRDARTAVVYAATSFEVGAELATLRQLELRVRYRDGLVVWINGREVARRNHARDGAAMALAERPRGVEWETFYLPVTPGLLSPGRNLLTLEVRPSGKRLSPVLDLALRGGSAARLVRGPVLQRVGRDRATLVFRSDVPAPGRVEWGPTAELGATVASAGGGPALRHEVELTGLPPGKAVHYRVVVGADASPVYRFSTTPGPDEPLRLVVYGDMRGGHATHAAIVASILRDAPDLVLVTGDLVVRGSDEGDWQRFFAVTRELLATTAYYPAAGNHDMGRAGDELRRMGEVFALPPGPADRPAWGHWYSFEVAGVHFAMIDSNAYDHADQLEWLKLDLSLARRRGARAIFALVHDGPYSRGLHKGNAVARDSYAPVLAAAGTTMLFAGHDHIYQRGEVRGLRYIVSGGGGAPLYPITCGVSGKPRCKVRDGAKKTLREHHYVLVTVDRKRATVCAKRPDGSPLEPCVRYRLDR